MVSMIDVIMLMFQALMFGILLVLLLVTILRLVSSSDSTKLREYFHRERIVTDGKD